MTKTIYPTFEGPTGAQYGGPAPQPLVATVRFESAPSHRQGISATTTAAAVAIGIATGFAAGFVLGWQAL
ncbi:hypothetical protein ACWEO2_39930 [Nocardia sp. NPDC004278]